MHRLELRDLVIEVPERRLLDSVSFSVPAGCSLAMTGPSGAGKTSLLNCLAGIALPAAGTIRVEETEVTALGVAERAAYRLRQVGLVFQFGELLPELTVVENVSLPLRLMELSREEAEARAATWLQRLGLGGREQAQPEVLSGGEVQRVAIARALAHEPQLVLADEPTGALDETNSRQVITLLVEAARELGAAVVVVTHDPLVAAAADRVLHLQAGGLVPAGAVEEASA